MTQKTETRTSMRARRQPVTSARQIWKRTVILGQKHELKGLPANVFEFVPLHRWTSE